MNSKSDLKVCVIGLGSMGFGVATALLRDGFSVTGFDLSTNAMTRFQSLGGKIAPSLSAAARGADIVICLVVNATQTETALFAADGAAVAMEKVGTIQSCATMSPDDARDIATRAGALGVKYIDAPISGGAVRAAAGEVTITASGAPEAVSHAKPVLDCIGTNGDELGDKLGAGAAFKIVNQLLAGVHIAAAREAITFDKENNIYISEIYEIITASAGNSWMFENRVPHILDGDYAPRRTIDIFTKDLGMVSDIGRGLKFPTPIASTALQMFLMTAAAGMGRDDDASIARMIAGLGGLTLPGMEG